MAASKKLATTSTKKGLSTLQRQLARRTEELKKRNLPSTKRRGSSPEVNKIIDGDFTDITPKKGFSKIELAALITSGTILGGLGALNAMTPAKLREVAGADADADAEAAAKAKRAAINARDKADADKKAAAALAKKGSGSSSPSTTGKGKGKLFPKFRPFGGVIARALLGDDEKFGGERGMIDFIRTKKKKPASKEPVKKNMGGMMKKKGYSKGGPVDAGKSLDGLSEKELKAMILRLKRESRKKEFPKTPPSVRGITPKEKRSMKIPKEKRSMEIPKEKRSMKIPKEKRSMEIPKEKRSFNFSKGGAAKKKGYAMGGMAKKGYANGGMTKKGYANGGPAKKTTSKKTASRGKARGVGAAKRGYGKAMR